jgi:hypothetical protein
MTDPLKGIPTVGLSKRERAHVALFDAAIEAAFPKKNEADFETEAKKILERSGPRDESRVL